MYQHNHNSCRGLCMCSTRLVLVELIDDVSGVDVGGDEGDDDLSFELAQVASDAHDKLRQLDDVKVKPPAKHLTENGVL